MHKILTKFNNLLKWNQLNFKQFLPNKVMLNRGLQFKSKHGDIKNQTHNY